MTTRKSTMASKYVIRNEPVLGCEHRAWTVYNRGYPHGRFESHEQALIYAIEQTDREHAGDWMLTYTFVGSRWIMFIINEKREMLCVLDNRHADSIEWRRGEVNKILGVYDIHAPKQFKREEGIIIFADRLRMKLEQATRGEWISYA